MANPQFGSRRRPRGPKQLCFTLGDICALAEVSMHRLRRDREQGLVDVKDLGSIVRYCIATNPKVFAAPTTKRIARMLLDVLAELEKP